MSFDTRLLCRIKEIYSCLFICHCSTTSQSGFCIDCTKSCYKCNLIIIPITWDLFYFYLPFSFVFISFIFSLPEWYPVSCLPASCQDVARVSSIAGQCKANTQEKGKRLLHSIIKGKPFYSLFSSTTFFRICSSGLPWSSYFVERR